MSKGNGIQLFDSTTRLVDYTLQAQQPIVVHEGGTSSSKTYSLIQCLFILGFMDPGAVFTVVGQDIPNLRKGAYRDAQEIMHGTPLLNKHVESHNKSNREIQLSNGSLYEFTSFDDFQDAKSGKRDYSFFNEVNGIKHEIFEEVQVRTAKKVFLDFNPTARFWAHDKLKGRNDVIWIRSTFRNNPFISRSVLDKIRGYEPTPENIKRGTANEYRWKVYGLGEIGRLEGLVYPDFKETTEWPEQYARRAFGLDFGFTNDPTALIEIRLAHGQLFVRQLIYETGLTNQDIDKRLKEIEFDPENQIIADSAEPKSIEELRRLGWFISPSAKGADSINYGITTVQNYALNIHHASADLIEEAASYTWKKDRDDNPLNRPIDKFNHGLDALRYGVVDGITEEQDLYTIV